MDPSESNLERTLSDLEAVLADEWTALRKLDRDRIELAATRKLELNERLRKAFDAAPKPTSELRGRIEKLKQAALMNQMLIAHARSSLRGAIGAAIGDAALYTPSAPKGAAPRGTAYRMNVRG